MENQYLKASKATPLTSSARTTRIFSNKTNTIENDIEVQKEYLEKLKIQRSKTQKLYQQYVQMLRERDSTREQIDVLRKELAELRNKYDSEVGGQSSMLKSLEKENETLQAQIRSIVLDKAKSIQQVKAYYQNTLAELEEQVHDYTEMQNQKNSKLDKINDQLDKKEQELLKMQEENERLRQSIKEKQKRWRDDQKTYQSRIRQLVNEKEASDKQRMHAQSERDRLRQDLQMKEESYEKMRRYYDQTKEKEKTAHKLMAEMQESKSYWSSKLEQKTKEITSLKKLIDQYKQTSKFRKDEIDRSKQKQKSLQDKISLHMRTITQLQERCRKYQSQVSQWSQKYNALRLSTDENGYELDELRQLCRVLKEENEEMMRFIKQKQSLERERRELVQNELQEINKFERLLKNIK